jgi:SH3 domain-containing YSC84-like protein 1
LFLSTKPVDNVVSAFEKIMSVTVVPLVQPQNRTRPGWGLRKLADAYGRGARLLLALSVVFWATMLCAPTALAQSDQRGLVTEAALTFAEFLNDTDMTWLSRHVGRAKAIVIAPQVAKAGFIVGGSGGRAVVVARDPATGKWLGPAFYVLATASVGFQAGISVSQSVTLVMTDKGLTSLLSDSFKMGGDAALAAGPVGAGARSDLSADLVSFSRSQGVYGGLNFDGTIVSTSDEWNKIYYGQEVRPADILVRGSVHNKQATELLNLVASAAQRSAASP